MSSDPSKMSGKINATVGEMKEGLGKIIQSKSLQASGREQSQAGSDEIEAALGHKEGRQNKLGGIKDSAIGAITGDKEKQTQGNLRREMGSTQKDLNSTARTQGYKEGAQGQLGGMKDSTLGAGTGHRQQQTQGNLQQDMGSTQHQQNPNSAARAQEYREGDQGQLGGMKDSTLGAGTGHRQQQTQGILQHDIGSAQHQQDPNSAARAQEYREGDRSQFGGVKDSTFGAGTGDRQQQTQSNLRRDMGSDQQDINRIARAQGYKEGDQEQFGGMKDSTLGAVTGDRQQQTQGNLQRGMGYDQQNPNSAARAQEYREGDQSQYGGMKDSALGAATGDRQQQTQGNSQRDMDSAQHQQYLKSTAHAQGYNAGAQDQLGGMKDSTLGGITGDRQQQTQGNLRRDMGNDQQNPNSATRAQEYREGDQSQYGGMKDSTLSGITGDKQQQTQGILRRDNGSAQQDFNSNSDKY